jgi:hypothetical protein
MFIIFDNHIFICTNQRSGIEILRGGETLGLELVTEYKKQLKDLNINLKYVLMNWLLRHLKFRP